MNFYKLSAVIATTAIAFHANAQNKRTGELLKTQASPGMYSAALVRLQPQIEVTGSDQKITQNGMDVKNMPKIAPYAISTITIWETVGKNSLKAKNQPVVSLDRLVPLLIGALKEQMLRVNNLERELRRINRAEVKNSEGDDASK
jgi:hypothetical protein